jgi:hypothetical protein
MANLYTFTCTWYPRSTNLGINGQPITPVAPITATFKTHLLCFDTVTTYSFSIAKNPSRENTLNNAVLLFYDQKKDTALEKVNLKQAEFFLKVRKRMKLGGRNEPQRSSHPQSLIYLPGPGCIGRVDGTGQPHTGSGPACSLC